jgi:ATP-dependent DNA ligase
MKKYIMTDSIVKSYPILYKKDKNGKERVWEIKAVYEKEQFLIDIKYGQIGGKIVHNQKEVSEGKNIGKKNETTIEEQLVLICDKTWKDKKEKELYTEEQGETDTPKDIGFSPMLADKWDPDSKVKRKLDIIFPCYAQPKLDGIRCLVYLKDNKIVNQSRQLKYFPHLDHINNELSKIFKKYPMLVLDGELYNHDIEFNQIAGLVKKEKLKSEDEEKLLNIQYHIYDCFEIDDGKNFDDRYNFLSKNLPTNNRYIKLVNTVECKNKNDVKENHSKFIEKDYEGVILRNKDGNYEFTRSKNLQKYKTFCDDEFEIIGFKEGTGLDKGTVIWKCKVNNGKEFDVRPKGTVEERQELYKRGDSLIGKYLTVTYQELSEYGVPRFPVGKTIRDYE